MKQKRQSKLKVRKSILIGLGIIALAGVASSLWVHHLNKTSDTTVNPQAGSPSSSPEVGSNGHGTAVQSTPTPGSASKTVTPAPNAPAPNPPTGDLLSTHTISLSSGSTTIESTCQTVAQITCSVQAKNTATGQTITPKSAVTDANGNAIIDWDAKSLSAGTWEIRLVATNSTQSATSTIHDELKVN